MKKLISVMLVMFSLSFYVCASDYKCIPYKVKEGKTFIFDDIGKARVTYFEGDSSCWVKVEKVSNKRKYWVNLMATQKFGEVE